MGQYTVHLIISIIVITLILILFPLIPGVESFANDLTLKTKYKNSEAYVICMSDEIYNSIKKKLEPKVMPIELQKFDAIKGAELGDVINEREILTIGALHDIAVPDNRRTHAELGTKNAIGCYLSHAALWTKLVDSNCDGFFIFESDAVCQDNVVKVLDDFKTLKKPFDILFFGNFWLDLKDKSKYKRINKRFYGTHAYYITKEGAKKCLKYAFPIEQQIDSYLSDLVLLSEKKNLNNKLKGSKKDAIELEDFNFYTIETCKQNNPTGSTIQSKKVLCNV